MIVVVDSANCFGCGLCQEEAPENLRVIREELCVEVVVQPRDDFERESCREAIESCPQEALRDVAVGTTLKPTSEVASA